jgi:16S rRNA (guanine527-N7)-methyltransferase
VVEALRRAQTRGLVGPGALEGHVEHALGFVEVLRGAGLPEAGALLDLGSGGGLPGLVVADVLPSTSVTLLESSERRCGLLRTAVDECGWGPRVVVHHERAETAGHRVEFRAAFDAVTARSFGPPAVTAECGAPFLRPGGVLVVSEPPTDSRPEASADDARWPPAGLAQLSLEAGAPVRSAFGYRVLQSVGDCPPQYARRPGAPAKRPLF